MGTANATINIANIHNSSTVDVEEYGTTVAARINTKNKICTTTGAVVEGASGVVNSSIDLGSKACSRGEESYSSVIRQQLLKSTTSALPVSTQHHQYSRHAGTSSEVQDFNTVAGRCYSGPSVPVVSSVTRNLSPSGSLDGSCMESKINSASSYATRKMRIYRKERVTPDKVSLIRRSQSTHSMSSPVSASTAQYRSMNTTMSTTSTAFNERGKLIDGSSVACGSASNSNFVSPCTSAEQSYALVSERALWSTDNSQSWRTEAYLTSQQQCSSFSKERSALPKRVHTLLDTMSNRVLSQLIAKYMLHYDASERLTAVDCLAVACGLDIPDASSTTTATTATTTT
eukprot:Lankesteria_metandrocarpae@DN10334_c0_g1_i1.p1